MWSVEPTPTVTRPGLGEPATLTCSQAHVKVTGVVGGRAGHGVDGEEQGAGLEWPLRSKGL